MESAREKKSLATYGSARESLQSFLTANNWSGALPIAHDVLCCWAADLANKGYSNSTILTYMSGIRSLHVDHNAPVPTLHPGIVMIRAGIKRRRPDKLIKEKLKISLPVLQSLTWDDSHEDRCLFTAATIAVGGCFRPGEIFSEGSSRQLLFGHAAIIRPATAERPEKVYRLHKLLSKKKTRLRSIITDERNHLRIHLEESKSDVNKVGVNVCVGGSLPRSALADYLEHAPYLGQVTESHPLFSTSINHAFSYRRSLKILRTKLATAGIDIATYRGLSYRKGGATALAAAGVPEAIIKVIGRWKSDTFLRYISMSSADIAAHTRLIV